MPMADFDEVRERRDALLRVVASLESALAAPAADTRWPERLGNALSDLRVTLDAHVRETETPGGVLDQVRDQAPRLVNQVDRLVDEHVSMVADTEQLMDRLDHVRTGRAAEETASIREQALLLLAEIVRHRHLGADLLYEAYNVDVGGPG
jgi:hypothetical protein